MAKKYCLEYHKLHDKRYDCPNHKVEGKYFIVYVGDGTSNLCVAQDDDYFLFKEHPDLKVKN